MATFGCSVTLFISTGGNDEADKIMKVFQSILWMLVVGGMWSCAFCHVIAQTQLATHDVDTQRAEEGSRALLKLYDEQTGLFKTMGWWNSANAITTLANEQRVDNSEHFDDLFRNTFQQAQLHSTGFVNRFYDDEGWWALAWIDVYEVNGDKTYLEMAESIFADMTSGWDSTCGGGIWWNKNRQYKNAIANELFLSVAAQLALNTNGVEKMTYLKWADKEWDWFAASGMINEQKLINDGLDNHCHNNRAAEWTYNQGVVLGGLASLSMVENNPQLLVPANQIAMAAIKHLTDKNGILHDPCEPGCKRSGDGVQFKGIFVRNLMFLNVVSPHKLYANFVDVNANAVWNLARTAKDGFSALWSGPAINDGGGALVSGLDVLVASVSLKKESKST
jgi:predicted alpha-1,6-mannanase (GH76 family)